MSKINMIVEIQKLLIKKNLYSNTINETELSNEAMAALEHLFFDNRINYAGWSSERKLVAGEEFVIKEEGIDVGEIDGLEDHVLENAREIYNAKILSTWRDKVEETIKIQEEQKSKVVGSEWAQKYKLTQNALGINEQEYDAYRKAVGFIESRNNPDQGAGGARDHYWGMYQFGTAATQTTTAYLKDNISKEDFEGNQDLAEKHFDCLSFLNHRALSKNSPEYVKLPAKEQLAMLGYAHNQGAGGAAKYLKTGEVGHDGFGTAGTKYYDAILKELGSVKTETVAAQSKPQTSEILYVGDSVAVGMYWVNNPKSIDENYRKEGSSPKDVLRRIETLGKPIFSGKTCFLSPGLLNNVTDIKTVEKSIQTLKDMGCTVILSGGPTEGAREDLKNVNSILMNLASKHKISFLGGYSTKDGIHPRSYKEYHTALESLLNNTPIALSSTVSVKNPKKLSDINIYQLAFIRGIGETETGFSKEEAYTEKYNQRGNNANVRKYGQDGADYGYYQNNALDVKDAIRLGVDSEVAKHLNGGGAEGQSGIIAQTIAMYEFLSRKYPDVFEELKSGKKSAFENAVEKMNGRWFGLKDRPEVAFAIWNKAKVGGIQELFPEVRFKTLTVDVPKPVSVPVQAPTIVQLPKKKIKWPHQSEVEDFFGEVGTNQVKCVLPFTMVLAWDTGTKINSYSCHKLVKEPMERIWKRVLDHYGYEKIRELRLHYFGGCLNVRKMRGGSSWSMHSWGIAVDIDPARNALNMNAEEATLSKPEYKKYWEFVYDEGAIGLGPERDYDWMHWQCVLL